MKKNIWLILCSLLMFSIISCGKKIDDNTIVLFSWNSFVDPEILRDFTKETGIKVHVESFSNNEDMLTKFQLHPEYYDVMLPSDHIVDKLVQDNMLSELNFENIPNAKYLISGLKNPIYDPMGKFSLPYGWGTVGIIYNKTKVKEPVDSWASFWDERYKGSIIMADSQRDIIGSTLKYLGYSLNTKNPQEIKEAGDLLQKQSPLVMGFFIDSVAKNMMAQGEATLAVLWAGDALFAMRQNPDMEYVIPKEGANLWTDNFIVSKKTKKKNLAESFINYMYRPDIALRTWEYVGYATPNQASLEMLPSDIKNDPRWYPKVNPNSNFFEMNRNLDDATLELYSQTWLKVKS